MLFLPTAKASPPSTIRAHAYSRRSERFRRFCDSFPWKHLICRLHGLPEQIARLAPGMPGSGQIASVWPLADHFASSPGNGHRQAAPTGLGESSQNAARRLVDFLDIAAPGEGLAEETDDLAAGLG